MFNKLIRYYNQNRTKIIVIIIVIVFIIAIIQLANYIAKKISDNKANNITGSNTISNDIVQSQSAFSKTKIDTSTAERNNGTIGTFIDDCNKGDIDSAYNMLSNDCKEIIYNNSEDNFKQNYYNVIFTYKRGYKKDNLISSNGAVTYLITYENDILSNGGNSYDQTYKDYITIVDENGATKLNIASFIGKVDINKDYEDSNIKISVISKQIFMNYETYQINFINKTNNQMKLYDDKVNSQWSLENNVPIKYTAVMNEINNNLFNMQPGQPQQLTIKYIESYNIEHKDETFTFNNIIANNNLISVSIKLD